MTEEVRRSAAYLPWATLKSALEQLSKGMPSRIDRSVFPGMAWNIQTQLFGALKFLGLLKGEDEPTELLHHLVTGSDAERKARLKAVIEGAYSDLISIDLTKATRAHFEDELGNLYSVTGDTRKKAVRFFMNAAEEVGIPLSHYITPKSGSGKARRVSTRPRNTTRKAVSMPSMSGSESEVAPSHKPHHGTAKSITLKSGGTLTLSATLDLFALNSEDRNFVFELIDKLEGYSR